MEKRLSLAIALSAALLAACNHQTDLAPSAPASSSLSVRGDAPLALSGRWLAFLADEATSGAGGTDLNGDGDRVDQVAHVVDLLRGTERSLALAARGLAWVGADLYLEVRPSEDGRAWGPAGTERALLHWSSTHGLPAFVDALDPDSPLSFAALDAPVDGGLAGALVWARPATGGAGTNLRVARPDAPRTALAVQALAGAGAFVLRLQAEEHGLVFATAPELENGRDLNGDGDRADLVLALLDATGDAGPGGYGRPALSTRLAVERLEAGLLRASRRGAHDWLVAFLVSERAQGLGSLDRGGAQPPGCPPDLDLDDHVLSFLRFSAFSTDPGGAQILSTGVPGARRIEIAGDHLATLAREGEWGACDLNGDGDLGDAVVTIVPALAVPFPVGDSSLARAVADVPGGARGLTSLEGRFVIVVDEQADQRDADGDGQLTHRVVGWLDPRGALAWTFVQQNGVRLGASWMAPVRAGESVLSVAAEEVVLGTSINAPANGGVDLDMADSFPAFARFGPPGSELRVTAAPYAVPPANPGLETAETVGFYRVLESADGRDSNGDGDLSDFVLRRSQVAGGPFSTPLSVLNGLARPAIERGPAAVGAAFLADERLEGAGGSDLNGDGDANDLVVRWILF
jgi:hypothetical protein